MLQTGKLRQFNLTLPYNRFVGIVCSSLSLHLGPATHPSAGSASVGAVVSPQLLAFLRTCSPDHSCLAQE